MDQGEKSRRRADTFIEQLTQANTTLNERLRDLDAPQTSEAAGNGTEPRWIRSRWASWLVPGLLGYLIPIVGSALGAVYVYISAINDQALAAVLGAIGSLLVVGLTMYFGIRITRKTEEEAWRAVEEANVRAERANASALAAMQAQERQRENG